MARFRYPKNPLSYLRRLTVPHMDRYFVRRGIGYLVACGFCHATPPSDCVYTAQKWRWLTGHLAEFHHGKEKPDLVKIGSQHGVERSQEAKGNGRYGRYALQ